MTYEQKQIAILQAIAETVQEVGEAPSGTLYAAVMGQVSLAEYERLLGILVGAKLVTVSPGHLVKWVGPPRQVTQEGTCPHGVPWHDACHAPGCFREDA